MQDYSNPSNTVIIPAIPCQPENLPEELRILDQWVVWRLEPPAKAGSKPRKVPYDAKTRHPARTHNALGKDYPGAASETWSPFDQALQRFRTGDYSGLGFVFDKMNRLTGVDLDNCRNPETGEIDLRAQAWITFLDSYSEISPSGTGVKIIVRAVKPPGRCRRGNVEVYDCERYFTLTGAHLPGTPQSIQDRQGEIDGFILAALGEPEKETEPNRPRPVSVSLLPDDAQLLQKARSASSGAAFCALYDHGDLSGHRDDHSAADLSLCVMLAFWCGSDRSRMDRLYRGSALMREKWDELRGLQTYGEITLQKAVDSCRNSYKPPTPQTDLKTVKESLSNFHASVKNSISKPPDSGVQNETSNRPAEPVCTGVESTDLDETDTAAESDPIPLPPPPPPPAGRSYDSLKAWKTQNKRLKNWKGAVDEMFKRAVGDLYNADIQGVPWGDREPIARQIWGERFREVRNLASVCKAWPPETRPDDIPFGILQELASSSQETREQFCQEFRERQFQKGQRLTREELRDRLGKATGRPPKWYKLLDETDPSIGKTIDEQIAKEGSGPVVRRLRVALGLPLKGDLGPGNAYAPTDNPFAPYEAYDTDSSITSLCTSIGDISEAEGTTTTPSVDAEDEDDSWDALVNDPSPLPSPKSVPVTPLTEEREHDFVVVYAAHEK